MMIYARFNLPFRFVDEGTYDMPYLWMKRTKYNTKVHIKLEQSFERSKVIAGLEIEGWGGGNVDATSDEHGIINHTKVLIEFKDDSSSLDGVDISDLLQEMEGVIKIACIQLLNKLGQIVRAATNNFWIRSINLRYI